MLALDLSAQAKREYDRQIEILRNTMETADISDVERLQGRIMGLRLARDILVSIMKRNEIDDDDD